MPMTPSRLRTRRKVVTFPFAGEDVTIEYYPAELNDERLTQLRSLSTRISAVDEHTSEAETDALYLLFGAWVSAVLATWDYCEDAGEDGTPGAMVPLTSERIAAEMRLFADFIGACVQAAIVDYQGGKPTGDGSSAPSDATSSATAASTSLTAKPSPKSSH